MKVSDILAHKINEIQSRVPLRIRRPACRPFEKVLKSAVSKTVDTSKETDSADNMTTMQYIDACVKEASEKYCIDSSLVKAVIKHESGFDPDAVSSAGAQGLMQLMPATAKILGVRDSFDIRENIFGGTQFLHDMLNSFNGDIRLALAAYNAGPATVRKYGGIPPYSETESYIERVMKDYENGI